MSCSGINGLVKDCKKYCGDRQGPHNQDAYHISVYVIYNGPELKDDTVYRSNSSNSATIEGVIAGVMNNPQGYGGRFNTFSPAETGSETVKDMYNNYKNSHIGRDFEEFMNKKGYKRGSIAEFDKRHIPTLDDGNEAIAQLETWANGYDSKRKLTVNEKYMDMLLESSAAGRDTMMHEDTHAFGVHSEGKVAQLMDEFYSEKAEEHGSVRNYTGMAYSQADN